MADSALTKGGVRRRSSGGNYNRGSPALKQIVCMIQPGAKNRRGMAGILSRAENHDRIRGMIFLQPGFMHDLKAADTEKDGDAYRNQGNYP
jgi:hypothetical protein